MHLDDEIELIAAGERQVTPEEQVHLEGCPSCARSLALAIDVHRLLAAEAAPVGPEGFVAATLGRVRRERWRSEQQLDLAFNVVVGLAALTGVALLWIVLTASGVSTVSADLVDVFIMGTNSAIDRMRPALPTYTMATLVLASGLGIWWWAERGFEV
jgi:anti-sigma factor RsiW